MSGWQHSYVEDQTAIMEQQHLQRPTHICQIPSAKNPCYAAWRRRVWQQLSGNEASVGQLGAGPQLGMIAWQDTTVEDLIAIVRRLPHRAPVIPAVMHG